MRNNKYQNENTNKEQRNIRNVLHKKNEQTLLGKM